MPRKSKVDQLPDDIKARIDKMLADDRISLDELMEWVDDLEIADEDKPSRSGLGRRKKRQSDLARELLNSRNVAKALAAEIGHEGASQQSRLAVEILQTTIMKLSAAAITGEIPDLSPAEIQALSKSSSELARAVDIDDKRRRAIREEALKEAAARTKAALAEASKRKEGVSQETMDAIYEDLLGVARS